MKKLTFICIAIATVLTHISVYAIHHYANTQTDQAQTTDLMPKPYLFDDMFFSTANVVNYWYYGNAEIGSDLNAYYMQYDDIDAGCDNEIIRVTPELYKTLIYYRESGESAIGVLKAQKPYETVMYDCKIEIENEPIEMYDSMYRPN